MLTPDSNFIDRMIIKINAISRWSLIVVSIFVAELLTAALSLLQYNLWWFRDLHQMLIIGAVDAFVVSAVIVSFIMVLTSRISKLQSYINIRQEFERSLEEAAEALHRANVYNRSLIEASLDPLMTIGLDGRITDVNAATEAITGRARDEIVGTEFTVYISDTEKAMAGFNEVLRDGYVVDLEFEFCHKDGHTTPALFNASVYRDESGNVIGLFAAARDITERKRAEGKVRESHAFLRAIVEGTTDAVYLKDLDGRYLMINQAALLAIGKSVEDVIGKDDTFLFPEDEAGILMEKDRSVMESCITSTYDELLTTTDGKKTDYLTTKGPVFDDKGNVVGVFGVARDITEHKKKDEELENIRHQEELILNSAAEGIMGLDIQGNHTFVNPSAARMLGYEIEELIGKHSHTTWHHTNADGIVYPEEECPIYMTLKDGAVHSQVIDEVIWRKDGSSFPVAYSSTPVIDKGNIIGAVINFRDVTERKLSEAKIKRDMERLAALRLIDTAISGSLDLRVTLNVLLEQTIKQLHVDTSCVLLFNPHDQMLEYAMGHGFRKKRITLAKVRLGQGYAGRVAMERKTLSIPEINNIRENTLPWHFIEEEGFKAYIGVPLIAKGRVKGVLEIFNRTPLDPDMEWLEFAEALAGQAAIALDSAEMFEQLERSHNELLAAYDTTIEGWSRALDYRDKETEGHSIRVTEIAVRVCKAMGMNAEELVHVRRGALLHDIGKLGVPDSILLKPGTLTEDEFAVIKKHPDIAFKLMSPIEFLRPAVDIPYCHHERWNGSGYPRGLKGEEIPLAARIFAVIDVWDALRSDRPYRLAWPEEKAREYLRSEAGIQFDAKIVDVFLKIVKFMDAGKISG